MKKICIYILLLIAAGACTKQQLMQYGGGRNVYMYARYASVNADSVNINFAMDTLRSDKLTLYVFATGQPAHTNCVFSLTALDTSTAVAGKHYVLPPADSLYIRADTVAAVIPVAILRPADLYEKSVQLTLRLNPNNNFNTDMLYFSPASTRFSVLRLKVTISDILAQPAIWDSNKAVLGGYSRKKLSLMAQTLSLQLKKFYSPTYSASQLQNFARRFQAYLNQQKAMGNTIREEDGSDMTMGPNAQ